MKRYGMLCIGLLLMVAPVLAGEGYYVKPGQIDLIAVLAPPPANDSAKTRRELDELLTIEAARTPAEVSAAVADQEEVVFRFADVVGAGFTPEKLPVTAAFFAHLAKDEEATIDPTKDHYNRPRPFLLEQKLHPVVKKPNSGSYPSGHATYGYLTGIVLADMLPEKRAAIFERAVAFGENRMVGGVHYRSDLEAGRIAATLIAAEIHKNPEFKADFAKAKEELRTSLGLH